MEHGCLRFKRGLVRVQTMANAESRRLQQHVHQQPQQLIRRRHLVPFHEPYGVAGVERFCFLFTTAGVLGGYCTAFFVARYCPADAVARDRAAGAVARDHTADVCASCVEIDEEVPPLRSPGKAGGAAADT